MYSVYWALYSVYSLFTRPCTLYIHCLLDCMICILTAHWHVLSILGPVLCIFTVYQALYSVYSLLTRLYDLYTHCSLACTLYTGPCTLYTHCLTVSWALYFISSLFLCDCCSSDWDSLKSPDKPSLSRVYSFNLLNTENVRKYKSYC